MNSANRCTRYPLLVAVLALWVSALLFAFIVMWRSGGHIIYALDDPYIHMAVAENFATEGVWGVTQYEFSSSSSSLLWTLLIASAYYGVGVNEITPFVLNLIVGTALLLTIDWALRREAVGWRLRLSILLAVLFVAPMPLLVFSGQEHLLHALVTVGVVYLSARILASPETTTLTSRLVLLVTMPLLTMSRYEGLFLLSIVCLLLLTRRQIVLSVAAGTLGVLPLALYGLISRAHGWYLLPNSVLLKGDQPTLSLMGIIELFGYTGYKRLIDTPVLLMLVGGAILLFNLVLIRERDIWHRVALLLVMFIAATLLHVQFAQTGWFFRYEAYLVVFGIFTVGSAVHYLLETLDMLRIDVSTLKKHVFVSMFVAYTGLLLLSRGLLALIIILPGTDNIYEQHYQMGAFVRGFYSGQTVVLNDIGAVSYLSDIRLLDIWGLANIDVAEARRQGRYDTAWIHSFVREKDADIAIIYEEWFENDDIGGVPESWTKVGAWTIPNRVTAGGDTVSFFAVKATAVESLDENLRAFAPDLPGDVTYTRVNTREQ